MRVTSAVRGRLGSLGVGPRAALAALIAAALAVLAAGAGYLALAPRAGPLAGRNGCRLAVALGVPRLEAAPIELAPAVRRPGRPLCRLVLTAGTAAANAPLALVAGDAWAGPQPSARLPFLLVAQRVGALLVAREAVAPHFLWSGTAERVLLLPGRAGDLGPTVVDAMLALHAVRDASVLRGLGAAAFAAGTGDYLELPLWRAQRLIDAGRAHFAVDLGIQGGPLPAAVLAASPAFARARPALLDAVAVAVAAASAELADRPAAMADRWPTALGPVARRTLARALARARYEHLWPTDPRLDRALFVRLDVLRRAAGANAFAPPRVLDAPAEAALARLAPPRAIP